MEEENTKSRKRQREDSVSGDMNEAFKETKIENPVIESEDAELVKALQDENAGCGFRLEAIFLPKFDNENRSDQNIRNRMKLLVNSGQGYAEASLKHSGSLLLWSGGHRFYSKNSTNNKFSRVGELLLRQHFFRAENLVQKSTVDKRDTSNMFQACSDYIEKHRLTLSFECVTSVLGDHGAVPNRDYLILTCVADRTRQFQPFYSTPELLRFAQQFYLPHNETWVFATPSAVDGLFQYYDQSREVGYADSTVKALSQVADVRISSMYPHEIVHSNILEGFVIRYVSYVDCALSKEECMDSLRASSGMANEIALQIPTQAPLCFQIPLKDPETNTDVMTVDVRSIYAETAKPGIDGRKPEAKSSSDKSFDQELHRILSKDGNRPIVESLPNASCKALQDLLPRYSKRLLHEDDPKHDPETTNIAKVIDTISSIGAKVHYSLFRERHTTRNGDKSIRYLCVVHVYHDQTFQKYRRLQEKAGKDTMDLFRGFCFEIYTESETSNPPSHAQATAAYGNGNNSPDGLILKMKFLPYMVRTFGCRNGLKSLRQGGTAQFNDYIESLLSRWGVSPRAHEKWLPYLYAWGEYAHACMNGSELSGSNQTKVPVLVSPPLSEYCYLQHLQYFEDLYYNNKLQTRLPGPRSSDAREQVKVFRGLVVVLSLTDESAKQAAEAIAKTWLNEAQLLEGGTESISHQSLMKYCTRSVGGRVCWGSSVALRLKSIRGLPDSDKKCISVILVGCTEADVDVTMAQKDQRKFLGMSSAWRKLKCGSTIDLPKKFLDSTEALDIAGPKSQIWETSDSVGDIDERPGLLVFFPASIPGCGKSTLLKPTNLTKLEVAVRAIEESMNGEKRHIEVLSGDKLQKQKVKYWKHVQEQRLINNSTITLADKNVPSSTWQQVGQICAQTNGRVVAVIPEEFGVFKTTFVEGVRTPDNPSTVRAEKHHYPFSLAYLAVCMARVMSRGSGSHLGKLDPKLPHACMVVCKFFGLYRGLSSEGFLDVFKGRMSKAGAVMVSNPVTVPFFDPSATLSLPHDLEEVLLEALQVQFGLDSHNKNIEKLSSDYFKELETRLRDCINKHRQLLLKMTADEDLSCKSFFAEVTQRLLEVEGLEPTAKSFINIVSVDISRKSIHSILEACAALDQKSLNGLLVQNSIADGEYDGRGFTANTHVTMCHYTQLPQKSMREKYDLVLGEDVDVKITGLVWSQSIGALSVEVADCAHNGVEVPKPLNSFPHVTVWHAKGVLPAESNRLPELLASGDARSVSLPDEVILRGRISYWGLHQH